MKITKVSIYPMDREKIKAVASITIDDEFMVHGLRVVQGEGGLFVAMPRRKLSSGKYRDIAHPTNTATREMVEKAVLAEFERMQS